MTKTWRELVAEGCDLSGAYGWLTCAVYEQHVLHPLVVRYTNDKPDDSVLYELGRQFYWCCQFNELAEADAVLDRIEDRVLELKREACDWASGKRNLDLTPTR